jgi:hypothetical protein
MNKNLKEVFTTMPKISTKQIAIIITAILLIIAISTVSVAQAAVTGELLSDSAYVYGNVKVWIDPSHNWYAFYLYVSSATYFKNQAQGITDSANTYVTSIGGSSQAVWQFIANYIKLPMRYNILTAVLGIVGTALTYSQIQQINSKIQQNFNPTQGIILFISKDQPVMIYNWWGNRYETLSIRSEFSIDACNQMAGLYGTNGWQTYFGCYNVWT